MNPNDERIQETIIFINAPYLTVDDASERTANPTKAPTIACVPDTGMCRNVAQNCHKAEPIIADIIPIISTNLLSRKTLTSKMFLRMVSPTLAPIKTAPALFRICH